MWCEVDPWVMFSHPRWFTPVGSTWKTPNDVFCLVMKVMESLYGTFGWCSEGWIGATFFGGGNMPHSRYSVDGIYWIIIHDFDIFWPTFGDFNFRVIILTSLEVWTANLPQVKYTETHKGSRIGWKNPSICWSKSHGFHHPQAHHDFSRPSDAQKLEVLHVINDGWVFLVGEKKRRGL